MAAVKSCENALGEGKRRNEFAECWHVAWLAE